MTVLVTGAAGFIGFHVAQALLARGERVLGIDNLNDYYPVSLKEARLAQLTPQAGFSFEKLDIADRDAMLALADRHVDIDRVVHLAAQAGVRHSLIDPYTYIQSNVMGQVVVLELARRLTGLRHLVYASSSSVYGSSTELPFSVEQRADTPNSLYAATKRADELIAHTYAHLYRLPSTGLRFFTVYGPWGRPDMSPMLFAKAILAGETIRVFNEGDMSRDFTYIDDIVDGVLRALERPPATTPPHAIYNLGGHQPENLLDYIAQIEKAVGKTARKRLEPMQPGDVPRTYADIESSRRDLGFAPKTALAEGIPKFMTWYRGYYGV
jgi:UDP-glucuronate 4-epimerase